MKKYKLTRQVTITVVDTVYGYDNVASESVKDIVENCGPSLAGEISNLGFADLHKSVSYSFGESKIEEI